MKALVWTTLFVLTILGRGQVFAGTDAHGADPVAAYVNLVHDQIAPDILSTVTPAEFTAVAPKILSDLYSSHHAQLVPNLKNTEVNKVPDDHRLKESLSRGKNGQVDDRWIVTGDFPTAEIKYNTKTYTTLLGPKPDLWKITEDFFHELGHQYQFGKNGPHSKSDPEKEEDKSWRFAQFLMSVYVEKCSKFNGPELLEHSDICRTYSIIRRGLQNSTAEEASKRNWKSINLPGNFTETREQIAAGSTCLEGYYQSMRKHTLATSAQEETVQLFQLSLNNQRKKLLSATPFLMTTIFGLGGELLGFGVMGALTMAMPQIPWWVDYLISSGPPVFGLFLGHAMDKAMEADTIEANRIISAYNKSIDEALVVVNAYNSTEAEGLLSMDRLFSYQILFEASLGSTETLDAAFQNFDPTLPHLAGSPGFRSADLAAALKLVGQSTKLCSKGLLTSAELGAATALLYQRAQAKVSRP